MSGGRRPNAWAVVFILVFFAVLCGFLIFMITNMTELRSIADAVSTTQAMKLSVFTLTFGIGVIVLIRGFALPTELDRVGCDLNGYGYGIAIAWVVAMALGRDILHGVISGREYLALAAMAAGICSLLLYLLNWTISVKVRQRNHDLFRDGVEWRHLSECVFDLKLTALLIASWTLGFMPTVLIVLMEVAPP